MLSLDEFMEYSDEYNIIPLYDEIAGDILTPISIYSQLCLNDNYSYLLESADQGRYSFIGLYPEIVVNQEEEYLQVREFNDNGEIVEESKIKQEVIDYMKNYIKDLNVLELEDLPPFSGGFVGYFAYEMISKWESIYHDSPGKEIKKTDIPMTTLVYSSIIIAIDHKSHIIRVIANLKIDDNMSKSEKIQVYIKYKQKIYDLVNKIKNLSLSGINELVESDLMTEGEFISNTSREEFIKMVENGKEFIEEGDAFQIVLSQKFSMESNIPPFKLYRALRMVNPSPYLFYLNFPEIRVIGSSPEVLVKVEDKKVITRPLAGTRPRGKTKEADLNLRIELLNDEKEKAEHIMLVDLGRNDLGRVCKIGSVQVTELMGVELFSRVMHIVSEVEGELSEGFNSLDVLKSVFPAGTVSGAPKIRAMEIIDQLEKEARGIYAGAVGYIDLKGNLDTCITIRTIYQMNGKIYIQAGAGIVADSDPEKEYEETINKARALFQSLKIIRKDGSYDLSYR